MTLKIFYLIGFMLLLLLIFVIVFLAGRYLSPLNNFWAGWMCSFLVFKLTEFLDKKRTKL